MAKTGKQMEAGEVLIIELIDQYGGIDGAHHKQWVLDQVMRLLLREDYDRWIAGRKAADYDWDEGIAP